MVALLALTFARPADAVSNTWNVTGGTWGAGTSWVSGTTPVTTDDAVFSTGSLGPAVTGTLGGTTTINSLTFSGTETTLLVGNGNQTLIISGSGGTGITVNSWVVYHFEIASAEWRSIIAANSSMLHT